MRSLEKKIGTAHWISDGRSPDDIMRRSNKKMVRNKMEKIVNNDLRLESITLGNPAQESKGIQDETLAQGQSTLAQRKP